MMEDKQIRVQDKVTQKRVIIIIIIRRHVK